MPVMGYIEKTVELPEDVSVSYTNGNLTVDGGSGKKLQRLFPPCRIEWDVTEQQITLKLLAPRRKEKALVGTWAAHVANMVKGVTDGFTYTLKAVSSHFPMTMAVHGNKFHIKNFLGEKTDRKSNILPGVKVEVKKVEKDNLVFVSGPDKELVAQTAANIELSSKIKKYDIRVFGDGVFIISKGGADGSK